MNPFTKQSSFPNLSAQGFILQEKFNIWSAVRNFILLICVAIALIFYFKFSFILTSLFLGTEIFLLLITTLIRIRKTISISSINVSDKQSSYQKILIAKEYYDLLLSIFGLFANAVNVVLAYTLFSNEVSTFLLNNTNISNSTLSYALFTFIFLRAFDLFLKITRFILVKRLDANSDFAQINQQYQLINKKLELINYVPSMGIFIFILLFINVPIYIVLIFSGFMIVILVSSIIEIVRMQSIDFDQKNPAEIVNSNQNLEFSDEKIVCSIFGIMKTAAGFSDIFKPMGSSILGAGKINDSENSLIVTNHRIILIEVPVTGGDNVVGSTSYVPTNFFFNREAIERAGKKLLNTQTINQLLSFSKKIVTFEETSTLKLEQSKIIIEKINGDKIAYVFMDQECFNTLKEILPRYLNEKFILS